ncbi:hypothetical protein PsorP6_017981 [Peronosclerospora sorghi]|uniref:Uncharacterized protein n=1 Tax=Peronosclerospora sorghi TaxID=230839 RepID=A0ACC0WCY1_9STRA|nr:hypothetical protein PsorP6_017981 [Peronosclerospora sorghi]
MHAVDMATLFVTLLGHMIHASDPSCFELPIVIVSPVHVKLPTPSCIQRHPPAPYCMKEPVEATFEVIDNGNNTLNCLDGNRTATYSGYAHYRGQSSLQFQKHQIAVDLKEDGALLNFPADRTFVLNGPTIDASLMRNHLAHWMFRGTGRYSPRTRHLVVFIRDQVAPNDWSPRYRGIYLALEKIAYTRTRVGLAQLNNACKTEEEFSGGWAWQNNPLGYGDYSPNIILNEATRLFGSGARPILTYPNPKTLTQSMRDYFVASETGPLSRLYQYLYVNMTDPEKLDDHIDIGSFVDYFLHSELSANMDAYRRSTYFFKDRNQPINAGPVWDFNLAYGQGGAMTTWMYSQQTFWKRLTCNYKFASLVQQRWATLRSSTWSDDSIQSFISSSAEPLYRQLDKCTDWKSENLQCANVEAKTEGTYHDAVQNLITAVLTRAKWMDTSVPGFYQALDNDVCVAAGELPAYNCAANGSDSGCLSNPILYRNAVKFPAPQEPATIKACNASKELRNGSIKLEAPSLDPCWLSAGVYVSYGSITPFCGGYGVCPEGPGAKCTCKSGHVPPTCARDGEAIVPIGELNEHGAMMKTLAPKKPMESCFGGRMDTYLSIFIVCVIGALMLCITFIVVQHRRHGQYHRPRVPLADTLRDNGESRFIYGTM